MSLTLVLMRHAKSSWSEDTLEDFDRPLNDRGRRSAVTMGAWLVTLGINPGDVIVSGARRTVDTWAQLSMAFPDAGAMRSSPALYEGTSETMLAVLRAARAQDVLMIGHNPTVAMFAERIAKAPWAHPKFGQFPTCATAVVRFDGDDWEKIDWGHGEIVDFAVPRELMD